MPTMNANMMPNRAFMNPPCPPKKTRHVKLRKNSNVILSILAAPRVTGHQGGHSRG